MEFFCKNILNITAEMLYFVRKHRGWPACLPLYLKAVFNLTALICIPLQVVLLSSFRADEKKQKTRHRIKNSPTFLCSGISLKYPSVEKLLSFKLFLLIFGAPELTRCCVIEKNITAHLALHVLAYSQKSKEFKLCSLTVPSFRGLPMLVETTNKW